jgi:5-hydroxyisourate hydrolase-like protein (transthyretin family)
MSAVIGAIFTVVVFLAGFSFIMWEVTQYNNNQTVINDRTRLDQAQTNEVLELSQPFTEGTTDINFNVTNQGSVTAHIVRVWITEYDVSGAPIQIPPSNENVYVNPGSTVSFDKTLVHLNPGSVYMVKIVTERGNIIEKGWASLQTALTISYAPFSVHQNRAVDISGALTCAGTTIPAGKTINLFYRLSGGEWMAMPSNPSTIDGGAYSYAWNVGSLTPGNYILKANFSGDADFPACSVESDSMGVEVLQDPTLTIACSPSIVIKNETITLSGVFTSEGAGIPNQAISLYRSSGSSWILIGSPTTSAGTGAYSFTCRVPSDLASGNYHFKAEFAGDLQYPARTSTNTSLQVLDPSIGLSLMYYPPSVHRNEIVTIYGTLTSGGIGVGNNQVNLYRSSGSDWVALTASMTSESGAYSYLWNVTDLAPGSYRLKANFSGDTYYPACSMESDYLTVPVPVTALTILYYAPIVHRNENVTIYGVLSSDGSAMGGETVNIYRSNGGAWTLIGTDITSVDGVYSYEWNVTDLSPGTYRLKANFTGDSYYPACSVESDYITVPIPITALTLTYYPPSVYSNDNVTISGVLTGDGAGVIGKQLTLYWKNATDWIQFGTTTTSSGGAYSYTWNVTGLSAGNYRLKTSFAGDTYYPACFIESDSIGLQVLPDAVPPGTGGSLSVGPFVLLFTNQSFQYTTSSNPSNPTTPMSAYQVDNDGTNILFWIQLKNQATKPIQISSLSFFLVEVRDLSAEGQPGTSETERYFHIARNTSTSSSLVSYSDYGQTIRSNETSTLKFGASSVGGTSFLGGEPMHADSQDDGWQNLCWTFLVLFWRYEGEPNTFGHTITYVAIRTTG